MRMLLLMRMLWTRDRIESAFVEWMAAGNAFDGEPGAAQCAVRFDGIDGVVRAGWIEAAPRPEQRADGELVAANQKFQDVAHVLATRFQRVARLARSTVAV